MIGVGSLCMASRTLSSMRRTLTGSESLLSVIETEIQGMELIAAEAPGWLRFLASRRLSSATFPELSGSGVTQ